MKDLKYITIAQVIGCLLVIWGHSYPFDTLMPKAVEDGKSFIYMFHMPLFVFCSGFLFAYTGQTKRKTFGSFVKQRAIRLLVPYFALSIIGIFPKYIFSSVLNDSLQLDWMSLIHAFLVPRDNIWGHFWFLPMIFFMGSLAFVIDKYLCKNNPKMIWSFICLSLLALTMVFQPLNELDWFGVNDLAKYGWSYAAGVVIFQLFGGVKEKIRIGRLKMVALSVAGGGVSLVISLLCGFEERLSPLVAIIMIAAILLLCIAFEDLAKINRQSLIAQTYQIFILSWPCQLVVEIILERVLHLQWWIILPSVFITGVVGPLILIKMIDWLEAKTKTRMLSVIIGK